MTNNCFKNALIGDNLELNTSWPCLNETYKVKKTYKKNQGIKGNQIFKEESNGSPLSPKGVESHNAEDGLMPNKVHHENALSPRGLCLKEDEFPELSGTLLNKPYPCIEKKNLRSNSVNSSFTTNNEKHSVKYSFKHPKLKKGIVNIPLLSFLKGPRSKKKNIVKRESPDNALCGNKLDKDQPVRRKGKVRLHKKKFESRLKKEIILSKTLKKKKIVYSQNVLKVKCLLPSVINSNTDLNTTKLESLLSSLNIEDNYSEKGNTENIKCETEVNDILQEISKKILHSQVFKEYCTNFVSSPLLKNVEGLIIALRNFQDRLHAKEPIKAFAKRRYICGFKESKKFLLADRVKLIIIATNLQLDSDLPSGRILEEIKSLAEKNETPLVFAGRGNQIGFWTLKRRRISILSVLNYEGAEELFQGVIQNWKECKKTYESVLKQVELHVSGYGYSTEADARNIEEKIRENILSKLSLPEEHFNNNNENETFD